MNSELLNQRTTERRIGSIRDEVLCQAILRVLSDEGSGVLRYQSREEEGRMVLDIFTDDPYQVFESQPPNPKNQTTISA